MLFKFLKKKIVLDCFTAEPYVIRYAPILPAVRYIPDWWKALPKDYFSDIKLINMRHCAGMTEYYKQSVALPLWCDLSINVNNDKSINWQFSDNTTNAIHHSKIQYDGFLENYTHIKIESPWFFRSEKNVNWVWSHPVYNYKHNDDAVSVPGITNFYYQHAANINLFIRTEKERHILIPHNTPMALLTPMSDRKVKIVRHLVDKKEMERFGRKSILIKFKAKYKTVVKNTDKFLDCPFHTDK